MMRKFENYPKISTLNNCAEIFKILNIDSSEDDNLRIIDRKNNYILIHYLRETQRNKHLRGVILDTSGIAKVVCASFPYTPELSIDDPSLENVDWSTAHVTTSYEGTILRIWYGESEAHSTGTWFVSTHKKINGRSSRWSGPAFGALLDDVMKGASFDDFLQKDYCYTFLLSHPQNRVVCTYEKPILNFVGAFTFENGTISRVEDDSVLFLKDCEQISRSQKLELNNFEDVKTEFEKLDWHQHSGLMVYFPTDNGTYKAGDCIKLIHPTYQKYKNIRGNIPNVGDRYLQLLVEGEDTQELEHLYPDNILQFEKIEELYNQLPHHLVQYYHTRYVSHEYLRLPQEEHYIIQTAYQSDDNTHTPVEKIRFVLKTSNYHQISSMIQRMVFEKKADL